MKDLLLPMNELTFDQLVELGRAVIPTVAPGWTDHNVHDPGIMLMELMAWVAEAQMYSLARTRRDERRAYAGLLGIEAHGPQPAQGLVWPFAGSEMKNESPMSWGPGREIEAGSAVSANRPDSPPFFASRAIQLTTARLVRVETRFANGSSHDWTRANAQESSNFMPFGDAPAAGDRLVLTFQATPDAAPSGEKPLSLAIEVVNDPPRVPAPVSRRSRLRVSLTDKHGERPLDVAEDMTAGLLKSGVLLLQAGQISPRADGRFTITLRSASGGFDRPPRVRRIGLNVLPVIQQQAVTDNPSAFGRGVPDQQYTLEQPGLMYPAMGDGTFQVKLSSGAGWLDWTRVEDFLTSGPDDRHFVLDTASGVITFGNGVNGLAAPLDAAIQVSYRTSAGRRGNLPKGAHWNVAGIAGEFGVSRENTAGGEDAQDLGALRTAARIRSKTARPLVTAADLAEAALALDDLGVTRAFEAAPAAGRRQLRGTRVLMVLGPHDDDGLAETAGDAESAEFLEAVRSRLAPKIPLGQRLEVKGPTLIPLRITASLVATRNTDPAAVRAGAVRQLRAKLALVTANGADQWPFGRDVTAIAVKSWLRKVEGVARVSGVALFAGDNPQPLPVVALKPAELPLLGVDAADIAVERPAAGRTW